VRKKVMTHLTISGTGQLTSGLVLVSIVIDIERIGDYAKNICDLAQLHPQRLRGQSIEARLADVESTATDLFKKTVTAFRNSDVEMSREVMATYKGQLSADCETIIRDLITGQVPELSSTDTAAIALYVRYLKRIAAHSRNIITSVVNPFHRIGYKEKLE
jgi:phosphate transport system protein